MSWAKKRRNKRNHSFVMIGRKMLQRCDDWKQLSPSSKIFYLYLKAKFNGQNNGKIRLHYSELSDVKGVASPSTIAKAIVELEEKEWIRRTKIGGLVRNTNEFKLTGKFDDCLFPRY
jgi:hypothetical protein